MKDGVDAAFDYWSHKEMLTAFDEEENEIMRGRVLFMFGEEIRKRWGRRIYFVVCA